VHLSYFFFNLLTSTINYEISDITNYHPYMTEIQICGMSTNKVLMYVAVVSTDKKNLFPSSCNSLNGSPTNVQCELVVYI